MKEEQHERHEKSQNFDKLSSTFCSFHNEQHGKSSERNVPSTEDLFDRHFCKTLDILFCAGVTRHSRG